MTAPAPGHDIIVVGASSGGIDALSRLVAGLPADLPAAVFAVLHMEPGFASTLPELLARHGQLRVGHAIHGEPVVPGRIYLAPPDNHLMLRPGFMQVVRGPKENGHRPAIDALFRTAATAYGPRVVGVVLTGYLDCGTAGLLSIKARGGKAIVQDPSDAQVTAMPRSAIEHAPVDHVVPLSEIAGLVARLAREPAGPWPPHLPGVLSEVEGDEPGAAAEIVCPICHGKLTATEVNGYHIFHCHVGHAFSLESVAAEQAEEVERALWSAARALEESASLAGRLAAAAGGGDMRRRFAEKEQAQRQDADLIRRILLSSGLLARPDRSESGDAPVTAEPNETTP